MGARLLAELGRRAAPHRRAPRRGGAARRRRSRAAPAAGAARRGCARRSPRPGVRRSRRPVPPPGLRREGGADPDDPQEQGAAVPGRLPAVRCRTPRRARSRCRSSTTSRAARCLDVGGDRRPATPSARADAELSDEALRLLYVAMTRARSQLVTWWFASKKNLDDRRPAPDGHGPLAGRSRACPTASRRSRTRRPSGARRSGPPRAGRRSSWSRGGPSPSARSATGPWLRSPCGSGRRSRRPGMAAHLVHRAVQRRRGLRHAPSSRSAASPRRRRSRTSRRSRCPTTRERRGARASPSPMADLPVERHLRLAGARRARARRPAPRPTMAATSAPSCCTTSSVQRVRWPVDLEPERAGRRSGAGLRHAARAAGRRPHARGRSGFADRLRELDFELPLLGGDAWRDRRPGCASVRARRRSCVSTCRRATRVLPYADTLETRASTRRSCAATSPVRSTSCSGPQAATSSSTTRPTTSGRTDPATR